MKTKISLIFIIFLLCCSNINISTAYPMYPLQVKYPQIMLYRGSSNFKQIALTFDDGPDQRFTPKILDVLKKHDVKATFFLLGVRVEKNPYVAKRIVQEQHVVGNHTYWHPNLIKSGAMDLTWEIKKTEQKIKEVTGYETTLFRAPYGVANDKLVQKLAELNYRGVGWSVDTEDWRSLPSKKIVSNVINNIHSGGIILMHSAGHWTQDLSGTVNALDRLIPILKKEGYEFVTIPEMWDKMNESTKSSL